MYDRTYEIVTLNIFTIYKTNNHNNWYDKNNTKCSIVDTEMKICQINMAFILIRFIHNFVLLLFSVLISLYQNYQLSWQYIICKQNNMQWKKNRTRIQIHVETRLTRDYFCGGRIFSRKCSKSAVFVNSINWNCIQYIFVSSGDAFLTCKGYLKQDSNNILKQFLYIFTKNFLGKVNYKSLKKSTLFWIFWNISQNLHHWLQFFLISKMYATVN